MIRSEYQQQRRSTTRTTTTTTTTKNEHIAAQLQKELQNEHERYAHTCYKEKIATIMVDVPDVSFMDPLCEDVIKHAVPVATGQSNYFRGNYMIFEDNCHEFLQKRFTPEDLHSAARKCSLKGDEDHRYHLKQLRENPSRYQSFVKAGLDESDAMACAYVISYYTGINSERVNRGASIVARCGNGAVIEKSEEESKDIMPILYYMVKALSVIPYFWGCTNRNVQLTEEELKDYRVGDIVSWTQFSSSNKGDAEVACFSNRNTLFKIHSLTGRSIKHLSNFPKDEDEVLYLPMSCFIVLKHQTKGHYDSDKNEVVEKHLIEMRQVELGISQKTILWVDDNIMDAGWENKQHMERASTRCLNQNIHFIPKTNTRSAMKFLKSFFGKRLLTQGERFRIVTDMTRNNEHPPQNAGARFIQKLMKLQCKNKILVFTSDKAKGESYVTAACGRLPPTVTVTTLTEDATRFLSFE